MMDFEYKVFISYNQGDYDWAKRIFDDLKGEHKAFLAPEEIRAGQDWNAKLFDALEKSEHLLALTSTKSSASSWVQAECGYFFATTKGSRTRKIFPLLLDQTNPILVSKQAITDIRDAGAYPGAAANVPPQTWRQVMEKIKQAITVDFSAIPIGLIVLAMGQSRFKQIHDANLDLFADDLALLLPRLRVNSVADVMSHYHDEKKKWQPFGSTLNIETITMQVMNDVNRKVTGVKFRWSDVGPEFYTDDQKLQRAALKAMDVTVNVVVVDLLSLYDYQIRTQLGLLDAYFDDDKTAVMVLTPVVPDPYSELMDVIEKRANQFFNHFYDSQIVSRYAHCGVNVCDERDMRRLLRATLGPHIPISTEQRSSGSGFLG
jgi:hypothetical protein